MGGCSQKLVFANTHFLGVLYIMTWVGERERGVGPRGPYISANLEGPQSNLLFWSRTDAET
jgi:hypothetical protein